MAFPGNFPKEFFYQLADAANLTTGSGEKVVAQFREALFKVGNTPGGPALLTSWKLKGFENVPDNYQQALANVRERYPFREKAVARTER